jgi:hypothetical protein
VRIKKCLEKVQQEEAFQELLAIMGANGGKIPYGAVDKLVKTYHSNGFKAVTRDNLNYRWKKNKRGVRSDSLIGGSVIVSVRSNNIISDLSNPPDALGDISNNIITNTESNNEAVNSPTPNVGGRKKGLKKTSGKENEEKKNSLSQHVQLCLMKRKERQRRLAHWFLMEF